MKELENLWDMYLDEIKRITKKPELTPADGDVGLKVLQALEMINGLCCDENMMDSPDRVEQSRRSYRYRSMGMEPRMYPHDMPMESRMYRRDMSMGMDPRMYPRDMAMMDYMPDQSRCYDDRGYSERRRRNSLGQYSSRSDAVDAMIDELEVMKMKAPDEETRRVIDMCIYKLERR